MYAIAHGKGITCDKDSKLITIFPVNFGIPQTKKVH